MYRKIRKLDVRKQVVITIRGEEIESFSESLSGNLNGNLTLNGKMEMEIWNGVYTV